MVTNDILNAITLWTDWANKPENKRYDIALFKIWINNLKITLLKKVGVTSNEMT